MLTVYRRGRVYWLRGSIDGKRIKPRSLDTRDRQIADYRRRLAEREAMSDTVHLAWPQLAEVFLKQVCDPTTGRKPGTQVKYRFVVARFSRFLEGKFLSKIEDITPEVISEYTLERSGDVHPTRKIPVGTEGLKSDLRVLRAVFMLAINRGWMKTNPVKGRKVNSRPRDTQPFTQDEINRMMAEARKGNDRNRRDMPAILLTFLTTGFRISDVIGLQKTDVNIGAGQIIRRTRKRDKVVAIELHPALKAELQKSISKTPAQVASLYLFSTDTGKPIKKLDAMLRALWRRCGIEGGHAHRFRDTFAVRLLERGASLYDVAKYLGITTKVCEDHYTPYVKELRERGRRLVAEMPVEILDPAITVAAAEATKSVCTTGVHKARILV